MTRLDELGRRFGVPPAGVESLRAILALQAQGSDRADHGADA